MTVPTLHRRWTALAGLTCIALFSAMVARYWHPVFGFTALIQLDAASDDLKLDAFRELPVFVHRDTGGYDGLYYAQIALDPTLRDPQLPRAIDNLSYRARRILPSALAWTLGAGRAAWIAQIYPWLNLFAWLALAAILWRLLVVDNFRGWLAWAGVLFSAGALVSVRLALTDLIALTILSSAMFAAELGKKKTALGTLAGAVLARETSLLAAGGLLQRPWISVRNILRLAAIALPFALWLGYVRWRLGPGDQGWANLTVPGAGFVEKWQSALAATQTLNDQPLAWGNVLATLGLTAQAAFIVARPRFDDRWWRVGASYVGLMLFLGTAVWEDYPGAAMRVLLPLTLAFNVLAHRVRAPLAWLIVGNLGVFAGLLAWRDAPYANHELAFARAGEVAAIARPVTGWFPSEQHGRHRWQWTSARGTIAIETWPRARAVNVQFDFALRSPTPRTVVLRENGREIWRGAVGEKLTEFHALAALAPGAATLEFSTDTPGVREAPDANARSLAFALYDLRMAVTEK